MKAGQISLGLVLTLLIAGCGGSAQTTTTESVDTTTAMPTTASIEDAGTSEGLEDPCTLLSTADLAAAAGGSLGEPRNVPGRQSNECDFVENDTKTAFFVSVYNEEAIADAGGPEGMLASLAYPAGAAGTEVAVGDRASFFEFPHVRNFIIMLVGGAVIEISGETSFGLEFDHATMTTIASTVAGNL